MSDGNGYSYNGRYYSYVDTFMEAGQIAGVSPYFLASRVRQEVGGGSSAVDGSYGYYNFFNIGAYASGEGNAVPVSYTHLLLSPGNAADQSGAVFCCGQGGRPLSRAGGSAAEDVYKRQG